MLKTLAEITMLRRNTGFLEPAVECKAHDKLTRLVN